MSYCVGHTDGQGGNFCFWDNYNEKEYAEKLAKYFNEHDDRIIKQQTNADRDNAEDRKTRRWIVLKK